MKPLSNQFTVGLVQMRCEADPAANVDRAINGIHRAAQAGAEIICLPELFRSLYFCQRQDPEIFDLAEPIPGPTTQRLSLAAAETRDGRHRLALRTCARRGCITTPRWSSMPTAVCSACIARCTFPTTRSTSRSIISRPAISVSAFDTRYGRIGVLVCWDQWFPEAARLTAMQGAEVLFYPTAIGWHPREKEQFGAVAAGGLAD